MAEKLAKETKATVIHLDDFFLLPQQRMVERLATPGENIDHERFLQEVLKPLSQGKTATYRPFLCSKMDFGDEITVAAPHVVIGEGSYSCHEKLWDYYDLHIFVTVDRHLQLERIRQRDGAEAIGTFVEKWIPMEEQYFKKFKIAKKCEFVIK